MECERCGSCCLQIHGIINISEADIRKWVNDDRVDILQYCEGWNTDMFLWDRDELIRYLNEGISMEMWFDPKSGDEVSLCPFLKHSKKEFECTIQDTKPEICRKYFCDPKDMKKIIKRSFEENLKEYRKRREVLSFV
jgi:Fe-S-cluster containining protein